MVEIRDDLGKQLLAGIEGSFEELQPNIDVISIENRRARQAWSVAEISLGIKPSSSFKTTWPDDTLENVLIDPHVVALAEEIGERSDLQRIGKQMAAVKAMDAAMAVITARLNTADCGIHHARDAAELAMKIDASLAQDIKTTPVARRRSLNILNGAATVATPEYPSGFELHVQDVEDAIRLFRAMRCVGEDEFVAVWEVLRESLFVGSLVLEGW